MNTNKDWKLVPVVPTLKMNNAGWAEVGRQGINPEEVELAPIYAAMLAAAPETPPLTVTVDPDARGVSVGVYQGSRCAYSGAHPIPASTVATEGEKDEQAFDAKLGAYIREWLRRHGWHPEDGEGEWEFAQRICYEAGRRDAAPYWARTYEEQDNYDQAVADAIKRVAVRIEFAGRRAPAAGDALDTKRLDFLATHGAWIRWAKDRECCAVHRRTSEGFTEPMTGWSSTYLTPRDAIDAAIAQQSQRKEA